MPSWGEAVSLRLLSREVLRDEIGGWVGTHAGPLPFVTLSYAQSLDGSIAAIPGQQTRISGTESSRLTHRLRAMHGAILVGVGTVLADDPLLTVRHVEGPNPIRVILDSALRTPDDSRLLRTVDQAPVWLVSGPESSPTRRRELERRGVLILTPAEVHPSWPSVLRLLQSSGIDSVMIEGGARVIASVLGAGAFDAAVITQAMRFLGGLPSVDTALPEAISLDGVLCAQVGEDLVIAGRQKRNPWGNKEEQ